MSELWERRVADVLRAARASIEARAEAAEPEAPPAPSPDFDPQLTSEVLLPLFRPLYRSWFRVEVRGIENVPDEGGALIVANHSGTIPIDSLMTLVAAPGVHDALRAALREAVRAAGEDTSLPRR